MSDVPLTELVVGFVSLFVLLACCDLGLRYLRHGGRASDGSSGGGGDS